MTYLFSTNCPICEDVSKHLFIRSKMTKLQDSLVISLNSKDIKYFPFCEENVNRLNISDQNLILYLKSNNSDENKLVALQDSNINVSLIQKDIYHFLDKPIYSLKMLTKEEREILSENNIKWCNEILKFLTSINQNENDYTILIHDKDIPNYSGNFSWRIIINHKYCHHNNADGIVGDIWEQSINNLNLFLFQHVGDTSDVNNLLTNSDENTVINNLETLNSGIR